ncbi:CHAT domain-containing protein [Streptomyces sp. NPDC002785]|uniref:CHAT domain-containing protein n=1 Tax=Streptomyces sp. NPDC002785 TaxID=3154543 RepID=UPI003316E5DA
MPLHAAGLPDRGAGPAAPASTCVQDRVTPSYTPTLRALLGSCAAVRPPAPGNRMLVVGLPSTPGHRPLPQVEDELAVLSAAVPASTVLRGERATRRAVRDGLRTHRWAHLSCHGGQDLTRPSQGGVVLHDAVLTVADLKSDRYAHGEFVFLSACQTALGGAGVPDEAMAVTSAFQYTGWRQVVGTLWSVGAITAAEVTADVYDALASDGTLNTDGAAQALYGAVRKLRKAGHPPPCLGAVRAFGHLIHHREGGTPTMRSKHRGKGPHTSDDDPPDGGPSGEDALDLPPETVERQELAQQLFDLGLYEPAESVMRDLLADYERFLGPGHPMTISLYDTLGHTLYQRRLLPEAEAMHREAYERAARHLGTDAHETLAYAHNLGAALVMGDEWDEGLALIGQTLEGRDAVLGPGHPDTLDTASLLGSVLFKAGDQQEGYELLNRAYTGYQAAVGPDHLQTLAVGGDLVAALHTLGHRREAGLLLVDILGHYARTLGPHHQLTLETQQRLRRMSWFINITC